MQLSQGGAPRPIPGLAGEQKGRRRQPGRDAPLLHLLALSVEADRIGSGTNDVSLERRAKLAVHQLEQLGADLLVVEVDIARLDESAVVPLFPQVGHHQREESQHPARALELGIGTQIAVEDVEQIGMEGIALLEALGVGLFLREIGDLWTCLEVSQISGDGGVAVVRLLGAGGLVVGVLAEGHEETPSDDLVDLVAFHRLADLLHRAEDLLQAVERVHRRGTMQLQAALGQGRGQDTALVSTDAARQDLEEGQALRASNAATGTLGGTCLPRSSR